MYDIESKKNEYTLNVDSYSELDVKEGNNATIQLILNILFGTKYSNPLVPDDMFLEIQRYRFETIDDSIHMIESELKDRIKKYIPDAILKELMVVKKENNTLGIGIELYDDTNMDSTNINIIQVQNNNNKIYIRIN